MDHTDAARLGHGDRKAGFGDCIHRRRNQRNVDSNVSRKSGLNVHVSRQHFARTRLEEDVVKRNRLADFHVGSSLFEAPKGVAQSCEAPL